MTLNRNTSLGAILINDYRIEDSPEGQVMDIGYYYENELGPCRNILCDVSHLADYLKNYQSEIYHASITPDGDRDRKWISFDVYEFYREYSNNEIMRDFLIHFLATNN